jgi:hypothetical protein
MYGLEYIGSVNNTIISPVLPHVPIMFTGSATTSYSGNFSSSFTKDMNANIIYLYDDGGYFTNLSTGAIQTRSATESHQLLINNTSSVAAAPLCFNYPWIRGTNIVGSTDYTICAKTESATTLNIGLMSTQYGLVNQAGTYGMLCYDSNAKTVYDSRYKSFLIKEIVTVTPNWTLGSSQWISHASVPGTVWLIFTGSYMAYGYLGNIPLYPNPPYGAFNLIKTIVAQGIYGQTSTGFYIKPFVYQNFPLVTGATTWNVGGNQFNIIIGTITL